MTLFWSLEIFWWEDELLPALETQGRKIGQELMRRKPST